MSLTPQGGVGAAGPGAGPADPAAVFARAAARGGELKLDYAGAVTPAEAWLLVQAQAATVVDVRTAPEHTFVGRVPGSVLVEWRGVESRARAEFVERLREVASPEGALLLLCRSGVRSHAAAAVAVAAGFRRAYNILEGFEGQIDDTQRRGRINGWRFHGLPWVQD